MFKAAVKVLLIGVFLLPSSIAAQGHTIWYVAMTGNDSVCDGSAECPFRTIQHGIEAASDGDTVAVMEGTYSGLGNVNLNFMGKAITVRSRNPEDDTCMRQTIIDANGVGVIARFVNGEGSESILEGFTLRAGDTSTGVRGIPGFFEFSRDSRPTTRRLRNEERGADNAAGSFGDQPLPTTLALDSAYPVPPLGGRAWDGYNPFHQPASTTDYYGSGDVNNDGDLTSADVWLAQDMSDGVTPPVARADVDGDGDVDNNDVSLINSALAGSTLPGWWNNLTTVTQRNAWIDSIMAIDLIDEHIGYSDYFVCTQFAYQTYIHGAFLRADFPNEETEYDGGRTVFNLPLYFVHVGLPTAHAINGVLIGDDPLDFDDWRFIEPQTDGDAYPGNWNMLYNSDVGIHAPTLYDYGDPMVTFYVDESGWSLVEYRDDLVTARPALTGETPDNRPDLWNPRVIPAAPGMMLFERMRDDMSRITDIHIADLPFVDPPVGTPLVMDPHFSRLLDFFQGPDGEIHLLWEGKDTSYRQNVFHGKLDSVNRTIYDVTQVSTGIRMINMARVIVTPNDDIHVFWHEYHPQGWGVFDIGIYWTKWTGSAWESPQNLIPDAQVIDDRSDWIVRQFHRYRFDVAVADTGDIILIWVEKYLPYKHLNQLRYDGTWNASTIEVMPHDDGVLGVDLSKSLSGTLHLAYWIGPTPNKLVGEEGRGNVLHRTYDGSTWSASEVVDSSGNACCPRMAAGTGSEAYMVWERQEGEQVVPVWNKYVDGTWDEAQVLGVRPEADAWYPTADLLPDGDLVIAWSSRSFDRVTIETATIALYGVALEPAVVEQSGYPGETLTYTLQMTNTGSTTDTFDVTVSGYTWPTTAPVTVGPLGAGASANVDVIVDIPTDAMGDATDTAFITATSQGDNAKSVTATLTTTANPVYGVIVGPATDTRSGDPGETVTYTLQVTNPGNTTDTFDVTVSGYTWPTTAPVTVGPLGAGASANVDVIVDIPTDAIGDATDTAYITVTSQGDNAKSVTATLTTTASGGWVYCADEGETCTFSGTRTVRYGANGYYNYLEATNSVACNNRTFGDPIRGTVKQCHYSGEGPTPTNTRTPTPTGTSGPTNTPTRTPTRTPTPPPGEWIYCADENGTCTFSGTRTVRYGANGSYYYREATNSIACNNSTFGDPIRGTVKQCHYSGEGPTPTNTRTPAPTGTSGPTNTPTPTTPPGDWVFCANEGGTCTFSGTRTVRYGAGSSWNTRVATGSIACNNATFGDPIRGTVKTCEYQE